MPNNYTCIIVDDEQDAIELLAGRIGRLYKSIKVEATYSNWEEGLEALREKDCDLLFMDISMPGKNGIELLKLLPELQCEIIFVTAFEQYALDAFSFSASGYVLKPLDDTALSAAINKAIRRILNKKMAKQSQGVAPAVNDKIGIPNNHGIDYVNVNDILYLESTNKCTKIVTAKKDYVSSFNLGKFKEHVDAHPFFQVHRSYIINLNYILRYESSGLVIMSNKMEIPVSRSVRNDLLKIFNSNY